MHFSGLPTLVQRYAVTCVMRASLSPLSAVNAGGLTLPWTHCCCCYSTKQKKLSHIIRWNTENKLLFGVKKTAAKNKQLATGTASVTKQPITTANKTANKTASKTANKTAKSKKTTTTAVKTEQRLEKMSLAAISQDYDSGEVAPEDEWWHEGNAVTKNKDADLFHKQNELYNSILDSGQGFDSHTSDWSSQSSNQLDIPPLPPISGSKPSIDYPPKPATTSAKSSTKKSAGKSTILSTSAPSETLDIPGIEFVRQCPLLPDKFGEFQSSAQEFQGFVETLGMRFMPTVNVVLNKTRPDLSNFFLQRWREKMIGELGEMGFKKHQEATIWQGTTFHACVQQYLSGIPASEIQVQDSIKGHWDSLSSVLPDVSQVQALETSVSHPWLCYKGTFDCIAKYKNVLYVIDWKTSSKAKPLLSNLYDNPLQVVAYLGAINLNADFNEKFGVLDQCAVVVAYSNGQAAHVHRITPALCQHYWQEWCLRLHQYWTITAEEKMAKK